MSRAQERSDKLELAERAIYQREEANKLKERSLDDRELALSQRESAFQATKDHIEGLNQGFEEREDQLKEGWKQLEGRLKAISTTEAELKVGEQNYSMLCVGCHGGGAASSGVLPDLRLLSPERHAIFDQIVVDGALAATGMPGFADVLSRDEAEYVRQWIISRAIADRAAIQDD